MIPIDNMETDGIFQPLVHVDPEGREWYPYDLIFDTAAGTFGVYIYAMDDAHAERQLLALKETGRIEGRIENSYKSD